MKIEKTDSTLKQLAHFREARVPAALGEQFKMHAHGHLEITSDVSRSALLEAGSALRQIMSYNEGMNSLMHVAIGSLIAHHFAKHSDSMDSPEEAIEDLGICPASDPKVRGWVNRYYIATKLNAATDFDHRLSLSHYLRSISYAPPMGKEREFEQGRTIILQRCAEQGLSVKDLNREMRLLQDRLSGNRTAKRRSVEEILSDALVTMRLSLMSDEKLEAIGTSRREVIDYLEQYHGELLLKNAIKEDDKLLPPWKSQVVLDSEIEEQEEENVDVVMP